MVGQRTLLMSWQPKSRAKGKAPSEKGQGQIQSSKSPLHDLLLLTEPYLLLPSLPFGSIKLFIHQWIILLLHLELLWSIHSQEPSNQTSSIISLLWDVFYHNSKKDLQSLTTKTKLSGKKTGITKNIYSCIRSCLCLFT